MERTKKKSTSTDVEEFVTENANYECKSVRVDGELLAVDCKVSEVSDGESVLVGTLGWENGMMRNSFPECAKFPVYVADFIAIIAAVRGDAEIL